MDMTKIPDVSHWCKIDQKTIEMRNMTSVDLMDRAAYVCWNELQKLKSEHIVLFCGTGNNGGDGLALARLFHHSKQNYDCFLIGEVSKLSKEAEIQLKRLQNIGGNISVITKQEDFPELNPNSVIVDSLFGTGLSRVISDGIYHTAIERINLSKCTVISIDIPSGLFSDRPTPPESAIIQANTTITFEIPKVAQLLPQNAIYTGSLVIHSIGIEKKSFEEVLTNKYWIDAFGIQTIYKKRSPFHHKGNFGHAYLVAGSEGKIGAALLAAEACLRSGVGLLSCIIPRNYAPVFYGRIPEAMIDEISRENQFSGFDWTKVTALGVGPGLGLSNEIKEILQTLFRKKIPLVLDADALTCLSIHPFLFDLIPPKTILTPHIKELERIIGSVDSDWDRIEKTQKLAKKHQLIIVIKGAYSVVCDGDAAYFNSTGNSGMATGGSGDVLTGIVTGLRAQGYEALQATLLGVFIHGLAADLSLKDQSVESLLPTDYIQNLGKAFKRILNFKQSC